MGKDEDLEQILLHDASSISFEREKYEKETYEITLGIKALSARALTSFDRQRLEMLEDLAKKKQLLNARQERYFDALSEFRSRLADDRLQRTGASQKEFIHDVQFEKNVDDLLLDRGTRFHSSREEENTRRAQ